jgi:hypothetical protein
LDKNSGGYCHVNLSLAKKGEKKWLTRRKLRE